MATFEVISSEAQEVAATLHQVVQATQALEHDVDDIHQSMTHALTTLHTESDQLAHLFQDWSQRTAQEAHQVLALGQAAHDLSQALSQATQEVQSTLQEHAAQAHAVAQTLQHATDSLQYEAVAAFQQLSTAIEASAAQILEAEQGAEQAWSQCEQELGKLNSAVTEARSHADALSQSLQGTLKSTEDQLVSSVHNWVAAMDKSVVTDHANEVQHVLDTVSSDVQRMVQQGTQTLQTEATHQVDQIVSDAVHQVGDVGHQLLGVGEQSDATRRILAPLVEQLDRMKDPLKDLTESVRSIADSVGVHI
jgi:uncharacterized protein Yka (UPF0111/DUF47 family)